MNLQWSPNALVVKASLTSTKFGCLNLVHLSTTPIAASCWSLKPESVMVYESVGAIK